jgi:hypothetical protein
MQPNESSDMVILLSFVNFISIFLIDYNYASLFLYLNSLSINYIIFKDFYFEIKNKYSNINFLLMPNYYPSNRTINKYILYTNCSIIISAVHYIAIDFWMNDYNGFIMTPSQYFITLVCISLISIVCVLFFICLSIYLVYIALSNMIDIIKQIITNYIYNKSLLYFPTNNDITYYCWICDKELNNNKVLKKLNCPCQECFHPDCIDKYLGLYDNYCRNNHKIAKYNHIV